MLALVERYINFQCNLRQSSTRVANNRRALDNIQLFDPWSRWNLLLCQIQIGCPDKVNTKVFHFAAEKILLWEHVNCGTNKITFSLWLYRNKQSTSESYSCHVQFTNKKSLNCALFYCKAHRKQLEQKRSLGGKYKTWWSVSPYLFHALAAS